MADRFEQAGDALQNSAQQSTDAIRKGIDTAKGAKKAAKTGVKAAKAVKKAYGVIRTNPALILARLKLGVSIFAGLVLLEAVMVLPSMISNIMLHQNDPEELSSQEDFVAFDSETELVSAMRSLHEGVKADTYQKLQKPAYSEAKDSLMEDIPDFEHLVIDPWQGDSLSTLTDEQVLLLTSAYNTCNQNALSQTMFERYQNKTALDDFIEIHQALRDMESGMYPHGNGVYGTDWKRDANGDIYTYLVAVYDKKTKEKLYDETHIIPTIHLAEVKDMIQDAHGIDDIYTDPYNAESGYGTVYSAVIYDSAVALSEILFGTQDIGNMQRSLSFAIGYSGGSSAYGYRYAGDVIGVSYNWVKPGTSSSRLANIALERLGDNGSTYRRYTGLGAADPWCAAFVSWCAGQMDLYADGTFPAARVSCRKMIEDFKAMNQWVLRKDAGTPEAGYLIFFDWAPQDGLVDHVGIVTGVESNPNGTTKVCTVEGNSGGKGGRVREKQYDINSACIVGYCTPNY